MEHRWTAEITNNPKRDYDLCIELWEGSEHRATLELDDTGELMLTMYPAQEQVRIPAQWLATVLQRAEEELPANGQT